MAKKAPDHIDALDDSSLDEYGVWVKVAADELVSEPDELVSELLDDATFIDAEKKFSFPEDSFSEVTDSRRGPEAGSHPDNGSIQKEQEVPEMSENDKNYAASTSDELDIEKDFSLGSSDDIVIPGDDDLGGLSDLLMNIDEEQDTEDTIYLEDDDLSLDLDTSDDLDLDSDVVLGGDDEGYDEDITIPGLDDLGIDGDDSSLEGFEDSLAQLDEDQLEIPQDTSLELDVDVPVPVVAPNLEIHDIEEVGLDDFLQDNDEAPSSVDNELSGEIVIEESGVVDDATDAASLPEFDLDEEIVLEDIDSGEMELSGSEMSLDLDEDISFDSGAFVPETGIEDSLPGATEEEMEAVGVVDTVNEEPNLPDLDEELAGGFDDVAAVTEELMEQAVPSPVSAPSPQMPVSDSTTVLKSIEEELHAIRSELTDLRSELKKLRDKGIAHEASESVNTLIDHTDLVVDTLQDKAEQEIAEAEKASAGGFFDDDEDETIALTGDELDNILNSAEFTEEAGEPSNPDIDEIDETPEIDTGIATLDETTTFEDSIGTSVSEGFEDATVVEDFPPIEEINLQEIETDEADVGADIELSPDELITGDDTDLMDDSIVAAEIVEDPFSGSQQAIEQMASMDIDNVLAGIEELKDSEEDIELFTGDEIDSMELEIPDELSAPEPVVTTTAILEENDIKETSEQQSDLSLGLKQEIKAVLAYMDQLLESLPEEKIEEFARSEHFDVYKKLFNELGL